MLVFLTLLTACAAPPPPDLPVEEIVARSAERMSAVEGFRFLILREGAPAYLDWEETMAFRRAEGRFTAPDRFFAEVRIILPGLVIEVETISIGDMQWQTNPITGRWEVVPAAWRFNPAILFDPQLGIQAALAADLTEYTLAGVAELEELPGLPLYHITGKADGGRIFKTSYGMIGSEELAVDIWIAPHTFELHRVILVVPQHGVAVEATTWTIDFWDFDLVDAILAPILEPTAP